MRCEGGKGVDCEDVVPAVTTASQYCREQQYTGYNQGGAYETACPDVGQHLPPCEKDMLEKEGIVIMFEEVLSLVRLVFGVEGSDDHSFQPRRMGASAAQHQQCVLLPCAVCIFSESLAIYCLRLCYTRRRTGNICATMYEL
jgi:hypothetical protein